MENDYKYKFTHKFDNDFKVETNTNADSLYDIMHEFVAFLKGCQFHEQSINMTMMEIAYELDQDNKKD